MISIADYFLLESPECPSKRTYAYSVTFLLSRYYYRIAEARIKPLKDILYNDSVIRYEFDLVFPEYHDEMALESLYSGIIYSIEQLADRRLSAESADDIRFIKRETKCLLDNSFRGNNVKPHSPKDYDKFLEIVSRSYMIHPMPGVYKIYNTFVNIQAELHDIEAISIMNTLAGKY